LAETQFKFLTMSKREIINKQKRNLYFLILLSIQIMSGFSNNDSINSRRFRISTSVFEFIPSLNLNSINYNLGAEMNMKNNFSFCFNLGIIKSQGSPSGWLSISSKNTQGFKIQIEGRKYFSNKLLKNKKSNQGFYTALYTGFQSTKTNRDESIISSISNVPLPNTAYYVTNNYSVQRDVYRLLYKVGFLYLNVKGITLDNSIGAGAQYINSFSKNKMGNDNTPDIPWNKPFDSGRGVFPSLIYQLKIGF